MSELSAEIAVPAEHPSFAGHFPGRPIVPGALLLDWIVAAVLKQSKASLRLAAVPVAKFLRPVAPGELLRLSWQMYEKVARAPFFLARADGARVVEGTLNFDAGVGK